MLFRFPTAQLSLLFGLVLSSCYAQDGMDMMNMTTDAPTTMNMTTDAPNTMNSTSSMTIADVIMADKNLTFLAGAIGGNDLLNDTLRMDGEYTVFAPVDAAFGAASSLLKFTEPQYIKHLENILTFHGIPSTILSTDLKNGAVVEALNGEDIFVEVSDDSSVKLGYSGPNGTMAYVNVTAVDMEGSNGVVHKIDGILLPAFAFTTLNVLTQDPVVTATFSTLVELLGIAFPDGIPSTPDSVFTVFAPTDEAFAALGEDTLASLKANTTALIAVLLDHTLSTIVPSSAVVEGENVTSMSGKTYTVTMHDGKLKLGNVHLVDTDILASDGIIHSIDGVLGVSAPNTTDKAPTPPAAAVPTSGGTAPVMAPVAAPTTSGSSRVTTATNLVLISGFTIVSYMSGFF